MADQIVEVGGPVSQAQSPTHGIPNVQVDMSLSPENVAAELARRAQAMSQPAAVIEPGPAPQTTEPGQPPIDAAPATPTVEVPDKFKTPDGQLDAQKLDKSRLSAQDALAKYQDEERALKRKMNEVNTLRQVIQQQVQQPPQQQAQPQDFVSQLNAELAANPQNPGLVLAKLAEAMRSSVIAEVRGEMQVISEKAEERQRQEELQGLIASDPSLLSPQMMQVLSNIRAQKPWINQSPRPWESAYREYIADQALSQRNASQVQMPNPTAGAARAPAAPVNAANIPPKPLALNLNSYGDLRETINKLTSQQKKDYYKSIGLPSY